MFYFLHTLTQKKKKEEKSKYSILQLINRKPNSLGRHMIDQISCDLQK